MIATRNRIGATFHNAPLQTFPVLITESLQEVIGRADGAVSTEHILDQFNMFSIDKRALDAIPVSLVTVDNAHVVKDC
jgi:hypothetical protein